jgi:serine phosphatase RsbU (regulator of sigma subunit)
MGGLLKMMTENSAENQSREINDVFEMKNADLLDIVLNGIDAMIYVTVPETGEILFINNLMKKNYGIEGSGIGQICYKVFQEGLEDICEFCPCYQLNREPDKTVVWEENSPVTKRVYQNTDCYIKWIDGRTVHMQHSVDITELLETRRSAHESEIAKGRAEAAKEAVMESINYASKIQKNLLPNEDVLKTAFADYSIIWEPRDVVGGDIYWVKNFDDGTVVCVCDCTGHGTPGALLTMLVVSALEAIVNEANRSDTAEILYMLDQRLATVLNAKNDDENMDINDGCDLAMLFIAKDGGVTLSAGNTDVFICDGKESTRYRGQPIYIGEGRLKNKDDVKTVYISANADNKFYIASDGLYDQIGGDDRQPFGYRILERIILENHHEPQAVINGRIWDAYIRHQGGQPRRDDFVLLTFKL